MPQLCVLVDGRPVNGGVNLEPGSWELVDAEPGVFEGYRLDLQNAPGMEVGPEELTRSDSRGWSSFLHLGAFNFGQPGLYTLRLTKWEGDNQSTSILQLFVLDQIEVQESPLEPPRPPPSLWYERLGTLVA